MFVSIFFLIYLGIIVTCYFCVRPEWRVGVLLLASYLFCGFLSFGALIVLLVISILTWISGIILEKFRQIDDNRRRKEKIFLGTIIGCYLLFLFGCKYISDITQCLAFAEHSEDSLFMNIVIPIGLSFYLFQAISYLLDVYRHKSNVEKNYLYLALYLAFFIKFTSGPLERKDDFVSQLKDLAQVRFWNEGRLSIAVSYMLWGFFLKMVIADRLSMIVEKIFASPDSFDSIWLIVGMLFYSVQIYSDFAGYSYIAIGCARIFGIHLTHNFETPYMAEHITDFWHRWHISLSSWLRDYLYIPLGGNRKGLLRKCTNMMIVFLVCGVWHGSGMNFIVWGLLHGLYSVVYIIWNEYTKKRRHTRSNHSMFMKRIGLALSRIITFLSVSIAWVFFRSPGLQSAFKYLKAMFAGEFYPTEYTTWIKQAGISYTELGISVICIVLLIIVEWICDCKKEHFPQLIQHEGNITRYAVFYVLIISIFVFGIYGTGYHAADFIYMHF